ncbi:MAG TPA: helix-turn-helix transcriptional regulator [Verrucomicrobiae bacterium]|jgi:AraC-like DNA-binding protein|nr:helix-turn-helix transcriptional regulator [Verrucomicrobiae bacterium]
MKAGRSFEPHLIVNELRLPKSSEWRPQLHGWAFIRIRSGISYWQQTQCVRELEPDSVLVLTGTTHGALRASQLNDVEIDYFCLDPEKLAGLLTLGEQQALMKAAAAGRPLSVRVLPPADTIAQRFKNLCANHATGGLSLRLQLLQLVLDLFQGEMETTNEPSTPEIELDGRGRLKQFLNQTAAAEFLDLSLADLAPRMNCSPRHLSRLFRQEMGASFRDKQTEMRLAKACQLLATSNAKVIDVALTSGYQSNSLFSLMFKKHFGVSPGKWRQKNTRRPAPREKLIRMLPV